MHIIEHISFVGIFPIRRKGIGVVAVDTDSIVFGNSCLMGVVIVEVVVVFFGCESGDHLIVGVSVELCIVVVVVVIPICSKPLESPQFNPTAIRMATIMPTKVVIRV